MQVRTLVAQHASQMSKTSSQLEGWAISSEG